MNIVLRLHIIEEDAMNIKKVTTVSKTRDHINHQTGIGLSLEKQSPLRLWSATSTERGWILTIQ